MPTGEINMCTTTIRGIDYRTGQPIELTTLDGLIHEIKEVESDDKEQYIIAPGLIDIQINGYKGFDFNKESLTKTEWETVCNHLLQVGVTTFFPTIITNSIDELSTILEQNMKALKQTNVNKMIGGFHLEGPYISGLKGPRGAHAKKHIKPPDWEEFCKLQEKAKGQIKVITLSPEWEESIEFIKKATKSGVRVGIGHTAANTEQIKKAVQAGANLSTHLGNGAHITLPRHPNYIWDQLAEELLWTSVISDGHHLPKNVLKVFNKVKQKNMILVSDSVALAGMQPGEYITPVGGKVVLTEKGRLHLKEEPNLLAGSAQNILQGVEYLVKNKIVDLKEAINKASIYPGNFMNLQQKEGLKIGAPADIILLNQLETNLEIVQTFKQGNYIQKNN